MTWHGHTFLWVFHWNKQTFVKLCCESCDKGVSSIMLSRSVWTLRYVRLQILLRLSPVHTNCILFLVCSSYPLTELKIQLGVVIIGLLKTEQATQLSVVFIQYFFGSLRKIHHNMIRTWASGTIFAPRMEQTLSATCQKLKTMPWW